jgi:hypothetical protein
MVGVCCYVIWQNVIGKVHPFELPYYDAVPADPTMEQMHDIVCVQQRRPKIHDEWMDNEVWDTTNNQLYHAGIL